MRSLSERPAVPYSLERTVGAYSRFPDESVDIVVPGGYRRLFNVEGELVLVEATQCESSDYAQPIEFQALAADAFDSATQVTAFQWMRRAIALDEPVDQLYEILRSDRRLSVMLPHLYGLRRTMDPGPFEGLVSSIIAQLISIRGAATVRARLVKHFGKSLSYEGREYWAFPEPEAVVGSSVDELCGLKMTSAKARSILAVARASVDGELELEQLDRHSDEELMRHLTALPGIGPWTAEWFLVNVMGRMTVVPVGDLGVRRSTGNWLLNGEMPTQRQVREIYEPFGEVRGYVAYYVLSAERFQLSRHGS